VVELGAPGRDEGGGSEMTRSVGRDGWRRGEGWGWIWGESDEVGALNSLDARSVLEALSMVEEGRVFDLGVTIDRRSYSSPAHPRTEIVRFRTPESLLREIAGDARRVDDVSFNTSLISLSDHAGTQIDGLGHATTGPDHHWYNGFRWSEASGDFGITRAGAPRIPPIIAPAVLLDVPAALGVEALRAGQAIGVQDLEAAIERQGTFVAVGDVVLVRTGVMGRWGEVGSDHSAIAEVDLSGLSLAAARWLVEEKGAVMIASDNSTVEVAPPVDGEGLAPVHRYLLVEQGVHMGELHFLEDMARAGVSRCCYIALVPKVAGSTAGFAMRPVGVI